MSPNACRFSQISDDTTSPEAARVFSDSRSSLSGSDEYGHEHKRRKTAGLNSRFDRMIETMNATYCPPRKSSRRRKNTASSANTSDAAWSPMDAYKDLEERRLGENFSLIKMKPPPSPAGQVTRTECSAGASSSNTSETQSDDLHTKPLPQWLCSTFSTLPAKHPLRLLLPKKPSTPQESTMWPASAPSHFPDSLAQPETDAICAFPTDRLTEAIPERQSTNQGDANEDAYHTMPSSALGRSPPSMDRLFDPKTGLLSYSSPSPSHEHVLSSLEILPFSTPGPNSILAQPHVPARMPPPVEELEARHPSLPPSFDELNFIPFSTPGPASTLSVGIKSDAVPRILKFSFEPHPEVCVTQDANFASSPRLENFTIPGPSASHGQAAPSNGSSPRLPPDLCLPPYHAAPNDPAPAYSSDDILEYSYYEDPLTDDSGSEPPLDHHFQDASNLFNVFATPGPGYRAPRPVYFDSPTEDPSDPDPLQPGYEIDYGAIDFRWEPFNRKSIREDQVTPDVDSREPIYNIRPRAADLEPAYVDMTRQISYPISAVKSERVPSPSPFQFSPDQDLPGNTFFRP